MTRTVTAAARLAAASAAVLVLGACGGGEGGQVLRVEPLRECLKSKRLVTNVTRDVEFPGAAELADVVDVELISPSAARLYVFDSVGAAEEAAAGADPGGGGQPEQRDNLVAVFAHAPTEDDRKVLEECFRGDFSTG